MAPLAAVLTAQVGARLAEHRARAPSTRVLEGMLLDPGGHQAQMATLCCPFLHTSSGWSPLT